ncbi:uncharacterized protein LOC126664783 [Mercurialis annua]|uniref:uncharacterized protein LOC126664783 n=1 Tax=Mercurialis annua TaxID=3986 RepID=UPI00215EE3DA|nr:uncharacterized protein LOC126664783 [Mercurialis annua]
MNSVCISNCVNDARDPRMPVRATYVNLKNWPESDVELIKSVRRVGQGLHGHPRVVDSISCRQMYLRSYTFSRKESVPEKTKKCLGRVKEKVANHGKRKRKEKGRKMNKCLVLRKMKEFSCNALFRIFNRLLSCGASVDVVDHNN